MWHDFPNGATWYGRLKNELPHGKGVLKYQDGKLCYESHMKNGQHHGVYIYMGGTKYEGTFENGHVQGKGVCIPSNGDRYEGEYRNGLGHGKGSYTWKDGKRYEGRWEKGRRHGNGTETLPDGEKFEGYWQDGQFQYEVEWDANGNKVHDGRWKNGVPVPANDVWDVSLNEACCICHGEYSFGDNLLVSACHAKRRHVFHKHCLEEWLQQGHDTCPKCRKGGLKLPS